MELGLLVLYVSQSRQDASDLIHKRAPAEHIAFGLMEITALYARAIQRLRGGWTCGTHISRTRQTLARRIAGRYSEEQLNRFLDFCVCCEDCLAWFDNADEPIRQMANGLIGLRPKPLVHPPRFRLRSLSVDPERTGHNFV